MNKDEAIQVIRSNYPTGRNQLCEALETLIPELKESEDERIRKELIKLMKQMSNTIVENYTTIEISTFVAWLEKQGEQKPTDEVKPKFNVGDWVQIDGGHIMNILEVKKDVLCYRILNWCGNESVRKISDIDSIAHLWTIQDAKDGDVLVVGDEDGEGIAIFGKDDTIGNNNLHCVYDDENGFIINVKIAKECLSHPATKEQRDLLFSKMHEAGYEWNAEKKELKKIEQTYFQKQEWTGYDEKAYEIALLDIDKSPSITKNDTIDWLKSLKNRVQPQSKQEWSEEDMETIDRIYNFIWKNRKGDTSEIYQQEKDANWLKSLKGRMKGEAK